MLRLLLSLLVRIVTVLAGLPGLLLLLLARTLFLAIGLGALISWIT